MELNLRALRQRAARSESLSRFEEVARILTARPAATPDEGVAWVRELCRSLHIPALRAYHITESDLPLLCEKAAVASSMKGNPIVLSRDEMLEILERAL